MRTVAAALLPLALIVAGCGGGADTVAGNGTDRAFAAAMVPHHESAIAMARIARERAESPFVRRLAARIERGQRQEVVTLREQDAELAEAGVERGDLGVGHHAMGMGGDVAALRTADPFDAAFLRDMVPHHEGAVAMARAELAKGEDPELKRLAARIVAAQGDEIRAMRARL